MKSLVLSTVFTAFLFLLYSCENANEGNGVANMSNSQQGNSEALLADGMQIFQINCSACHGLDKALTGPALRGSLERWANDTTRLKTFISNSELMIKSGDKHALALYDEYNQTMMPSFTFLTEQQLDALIVYISQKS